MNLKLTINNGTDKNEFLAPERIVIVELRGDMELVDAVKIRLQQFAQEFNLRMT